MVGRSAAGTCNWSGIAHMTHAAQSHEKTTRVSARIAVQTESALSATVPLPANSGGCPVIQG